MAWPVTMMVVAVAFAVALLLTVNDVAPIVATVVFVGRSAFETGAPMYSFAMLEDETLVMLSLPFAIVPVIGK